ncbi:hypothetical protein BT63DRAFT_484281 [Microthyrium microscopicum]|uniref:RNA recognition motif-containing protein n=1 Tax=Microthyrium microscopicum TaxID=703497 RepID=A0A6A6TXI9_9PEZI|nr:hypothetical protein BT63DRAFT_484281 [Microthyrium microscopicum]
MPLLQGEVLLLTLYADCHFYFSAPNTKPLHDRFDRRSYVYLYHDALNRRGRLEVANHAGTPDQDAFNGYLDSADIEYSYKHPTLFTITVHGRILSNTTPVPSPQQDVSQWHLPSLDIRNENKYLHKIHTTDLYFWTVEDSGLFLDSLKRVLAPGQLRILDANSTHPEHRDSMSPVVQQLEKVAIGTPTFAQPPRSNSISTTHTNNSTVPANGQTPVSPPSSPPVEQQVPGFAPAAYNPAAPAAPEPIAHREKTPPPPDAETGTGLGAAAMHDHPAAMHQQQQYMNNPLQQSFAPQPTGGMYNPGGLSISPQPGMHGGHSISPQPGIQRANTMGQHPPQPIGIPGPPSAVGMPPQSPYAPSFGPPPTAATPSFGPPPTVATGTPQNDPNSQFMPQQQHTPVQHATPNQGLQRTNTLPFQGTGYPAQQPQYAAAPSTPSFGPGAMPSPGIFPGAPQAAQPFNPTAGQQQVNNYGYGVPGQGVQHGMHQQVYIPEGMGENAKPAQAGGGQPAATGGFEQRMGKVEKGVGRFLKKLDKKF